MVAAGYPPDDDLFAEMAMQNPWWAGGRMPAAWTSEFKRPGYAEMLDRIDDHPVHAVLGARQVGKTTLLYQLAARLVAGGDPKRVMVVRLDEPALLSNTDNLRRMLDMYALRVLGESPHGIAQRTYVMLDEVQSAKDWQRVVKAAVDRRGPTTFIVSGSSSADIFGTSESLIGRIRHQRMGPMGFLEYLRFAKSPHAASLGRPAARLRGALSRSVKDRSARRLAEGVGEALASLASARHDLAVRLREYMLYGGYPGVAATAGGDYKTAELKAHVRLSMYNDIVKVGSIRNPAIVEHLFYMLAQRSPRLVNKDKAIGSLGINRRTLDAYLHLLKSTYMVSYASQYAPGRPVQGRTEKKVYVDDVGIRNAALSISGSGALSNPAEAGMMAETVACSHTRRLWLSLEPAAMAETPHYWRSSRGDEVDLVIELHGAAVPIEVKYRQRVGPADLKGLSRFADRFGSRVALALTQDHSGLVDDTTVAVPLWLYLLMCG